MRLVLTTGLAAVLLTTWQISPARTQASITVGKFYNESSARLGKVIPGSSGCADATQNHCFVSFNLVPSGKQLLITDASCKFGTSPNSVILGASVGSASKDNQLTGRSQQLTTTLKHSGPSIQSYYVVKDTALVLVRSGERPIILLQANGNTSFDGGCFIAGKIGNPPE